MTEELKKSISIHTHFCDFVKHNEVYPTKNIKLNMQALKQREQLTSSAYNYTAFIAKVEVINKYIIDELTKRGISAKLSDNKSLTKPQLRFDHWHCKVYANKNYQYVILDNYLPDNANAQCKHSYTEYAISVMPDRTAANNPSIRINFGRVLGNDHTVMSWKDRSRQDSTETHKFYKRTETGIYLSHVDSARGHHNKYFVSTVEQDNGDINIDEIIDFAASYQTTVHAQSSLIFKELKKASLRLARELRPLNKVLDTCEFKSVTDLNLDKFAYKSISDKINYFDECKYSNGLIQITISYNNNLGYSYQISCNNSASNYGGGTSISTSKIIETESFTNDIKQAQVIANMMVNIN